MSAAPIPWKHIRNVLVLFAPLWIGAVLIFTMIGTSYWFLSDSVYVARQPLVVRDEATSAVDRLGRFASQTELKAAQETVLEMALNREVVMDALQQIGPPENAEEDWPSITDVEYAIKKSVNVLAPQGAEFGNTEVVYLQAKANSRERAVAFCLALHDQLIKRLSEVRRVRAESVIVELTHTRDLAEANLEDVTARMKQIEVDLGVDLAELRNLNDSYSGDQISRRTLAQSKEQLQQAELELEKLQSLYELLVAGSKDPQTLLISGGDLLNSQPSLQRLKDGLIDAQLKASQLSGVYTLENPKRKAAIATEKEIRDRIVQEANSVVESMKPMLELQTAQMNKLRNKVEMLSGNLEKLAEARTSYAKIDAELQQRTEQLADAERRLVEAEATRSAASATSLVAALGPPQVSDKPDGPGLSTLTFGSMFAGLIFGLGTVFMIAPAPAQSHGRRRWTDHVQEHNRRAEDRAQLATQGRRSTDRQDSQASMPDPGDAQS